jgi:hypothetical protein
MRVLPAPVGAMVKRSRGSCGKKTSQRGAAEWTDFEDRTAAVGQELRYEYICGKDAGSKAFMRAKGDFQPICTSRSHAILAYCFVAESRALSSSIKVSKKQSRRPAVGRDMAVSVSAKKLQVLATLSPAPTEGGGLSGKATRLTCKSFPRLNNFRRGWVTQTRRSPFPCRTRNQTRSSVNWMKELLRMTSAS